MFGNDLHSPAPANSLPESSTCANVGGPGQSGKASGASVPRLFKMQPPGARPWAQFCTPLYGLALSGILPGQLPRLFSKVGNRIGVRIESFIEREPMRVRREQVVAFLRHFAD